MSRINEDLDAPIHRPGADKSKVRIAPRIIKHAGGVVRVLRDGVVSYVAGPRIGRNDPCPCACGLKAKKCERGLAAIEAGRWS